MQILKYVGPFHCWQATGDCIPLDRARVRASMRTKFPWDTKRSTRNSRNAGASVLLPPLRVIDAVKEGYAK